MAKQTLSPLLEIKGKSVTTNAAITSVAAAGVKSFRASRATRSVIFTGGRSSVPRVSEKTFPSQD